MFKIIFYSSVTYCVKCCPHNQWNILPEVEVIAEKKKTNMSSFSDQNFVKKLAELNGTQQSIQTLSLWLIHHRKHSKSIIQVWYRELQKGKFDLFVILPVPSAPYVFFG